MLRTLSPGNMYPVNALHKKQGEKRKEKDR